MKLRRAGPEMEKPPLVVVLCGLGYQIHPFTREVVLPHTCIPQSIPLLACGGFIGSVLRTLMGLTRYGLCLASTCLQFQGLSPIPCGIGTLRGTLVPF